MGDVLKHPMHDYKNSTKIQKENPQKKHGEGDTRSKDDADDSPDKLGIPPMPNRTLLSHPSEISRTPASDLAISGDVLGAPQNLRYPPEGGNALGGTPEQQPVDMEERYSTTYCRGRGVDPNGNNGI